MSSLRAWHSVVGTALTVALAFVFFTDSWDFLFPILASAATAFLAGNFVFALGGRSRRAEKQLWDLREFRNHQDFSLAAAREVWETEPADSALELNVKLSGAVSGPETKAPLSKAPSLAWTPAVEGYKKTKLGAEGDFTPLVSKTEWEGLSLSDGGLSVRLERPGLLNAGNFREEVTTWTRLDRWPEIKPLAGEALALLGLKKDSFPGVRIRETRLGAGERVTVYGALTRENGAFVLRGNDVLDDPGCLLILADRARDKLRLRAKRSGAFWLNLLLLVISLPVLAVAWGVEWKEHRGKVRLTPTGQHLVLAFGAGDDLKVWTFDPSDNGVVTLTSDDQDWLAAAEAELTVTTFEGTTEDYGAGHSALGFEDGHWVVPAPKLGHRKGALWFRNTTSQTYILHFPGTEGEKYTWSLDPHEGQSSEHGNRIVLDDEDLPIAEGSSVVLEHGEEVVRHLVAGVSPELRWDASRKAWQLDLTTDNTTLPTYPVWAAPLADQHLRGTVLEPYAGQPETFDLAPEPRGSPRALLSVVGDPYVLREGQTLRLRRTPETVLYQGPLSGYAKASWKGDHWELKP